MISSHLPDVIGALMHGTYIMHVDHLLGLIIPVLAVIVMPSACDELVLSVQVLFRQHQVLSLYTAKAQACMSCIGL